ncbi:acyltransferase family protein [Brevundimonas mediterranea]|uniref:Acyltransferase 3 domain-containing protein n=1 Tax=Brevundimonas mediterranea TaxID=74329 RepID=A0A7W6A1A9_9CAUL|nr:acyltransferase family protein [Brevundimonas mediterranea]MBB3871409.1 hypothetical protein [Brevundimonas mediterranea]
MSVPPPLAPPSAMTGRRYDLDWIRVGAFMLLILYHVGMFYVPWDYHVNSPRPVEALEPIMLLTNPWRLTLLFLVSGCATRFLADGFAARGQSGWALAGSRTLRLLPPLLFGMFVIVPPQSYYEILEAAKGLGIADPAHGPVLKDFWVRYVTSTGHWCDADGCLTTPTWNHLWFIAYLLPYSLLLTVMIAFPPVRRALQAVGDRVFRGWGLVVWPVLYLILIRWFLAPRFEITHALTDDWYNHALSFGAFLFGYLIARSEEARQTLMRLRWPALIIALCSWVAWATYAWVYRGDVNPSEPLRQAMRIVYALDQAGFIAAILGFGARWLNRGGPALRYLSVGVFPFYIVHQTVTVVAAYNLATLHLPLGVEAGLLILITALGCLLAYEVARRIGWLGLLLGVKPQKEGRTARSPA